MHRVERLDEKEFCTVRNIIESESPEVTRVEEKLDSVVTRLQKAEDLQMENDHQVEAEVDAQGPWFHMVRERIHDVKLRLKNRQRKIRARSSSSLH